MGSIETPMRDSRSGIVVRYLRVAKNSLKELPMNSEFFFRASRLKWEFGCRPFPRRHWQPITWLEGSHLALARTELHFDEMRPKSRCLNGCSRTLLWVTRAFAFGEQLSRFLSGSSCIPSVSHQLALRSAFFTSLTFSLS